MDLQLDDRDRSLLRGDAGPGASFAMRVVVAAARAADTDQLIDIESAHVDSCLWHGQASLDFARRLVDGGALVQVPTSLNVASVDLIHTERAPRDPERAGEGRILMRLYEQLGCEPTWTCAPYQIGVRPGLGTHVAWAESNAIVFANSVLGARTARYGDFMDICAAVTGRVPLAGLHLVENRRATVAFDVSGLPAEVLQSDLLPPVLGFLIGREAGSAVPVIVGWEPGPDEDGLKALGAAAASSGAIALIHVVGTTPEAPTLSAACHDRPTARTIAVDLDSLRRVHQSLQVGQGEPVVGVALGTPHYSVQEFRRLHELLDGRPVRLPVWVNTSRSVLLELGLHGWAADLAGLGVEIVVDTCTYLAPMMGVEGGIVLTDSAKWAHYAPANIGARPLLTSVAACVEAAVTGVVTDLGVPW